MFSLTVSDRFIWLIQIFIKKQIGCCGILSLNFVGIINYIINAFRFQKLINFITIFEINYNWVFVDFGERSCLPLDAGVYEIHFKPIFSKVLLSKPLNNFRLLVEKIESNYLLARNFVFELVEWFYFLNGGHFKFIFLFLIIIYVQNKIKIIK